MDHDVMATHVHGLLAFKKKIEEMMHGADGNVEKATDTLDQLVADVAKIKQDLASALAWIAEQQQKAKIGAQLTLDQLNASTKPQAA